MHVHWISVIRSSDIWSFWLLGQFLAGPEPNGISYNKFFRIYGHFWSTFRIYGQFFEAVGADFEAGDASFEAVDAVEAATYHQSTRVCHIDGDPSSFSRHKHFPAHFFLHIHKNFPVQNKVNEK